MSNVFGVHAPISSLDLWASQDHSDRISWHLFHTFRPPIKISNENPELMMEVTMMLSWQNLEVTMTTVKRMMTKAIVKQQRRKMFQGYCKSWDLAELAGLCLIMHTINFTKVSFLPFHSIACFYDNTKAKTLFQCMCVYRRGGGHNFLGRQQGEGWNFLGPKFGRGQNFWAIVFVNLPALSLPPVINDRSLSSDEHWGI